MILLIGCVIVLTMLLKAGLKKVGVPPLVGYFILGFLLSLTNNQWHILSSACAEIFEFLAKIGLICLLFRVGLESNLQGLLAQLRRATIIWIGNVGISGLMGFFTAFYLLHLTLITSLIIAVASTATSVGISVAVWEEQEALSSASGELLVDVAELDDITAVVVMAMLFTLLPSLKGEGGSWSLLPELAGTLSFFTLKFLFFGAFCFFFAQYMEQPMTKYFRHLRPAQDVMLIVVSIGFIIAALAELLGFSLAVGAFFAGLVFSRDPDTIKIEGSFLPLYELFTPLFFIGIGLDLDASSMVPALGLGLILTGAAVAGKVIGAGVPVGLMSGLSGGLLIGVSMVPRAEIAMIIMHRGLKLGDWAVPANVYGAMVLVSALTCIGAPPVVRYLFNKWPQGETA